MTVGLRQQAQQKLADSQGLLPDFCNVRMVFSMVVLAELLAFILALGPQVSDGGRWHDLSLISLFIQWVVLGNCAVLCMLRGKLQSFSLTAVTVMTVALVVAVTLLISELSYIISRQAGFEALLPTQWHIEFLLRNAAISLIITLAALRFFYLQSRLSFNIEARSRAQVEALQARIRPHFLFNSMNTIASLTRSQPALAETLVEDLADLFRVSLADNQTLTSLADEIQLSRRYLNIEQTRLGERLQIEWDLVDPPLNSRIPALTLQPLLENAIYHGIEPLAEGGTIKIRITEQNQCLLMTITNPLSRTGAKRRHHGHHMALANTRARIAAYFGDAAELKTEQLGAEQFRVSLSWPINSPLYQLDNEKSDARSDL